MKLAETQAEIRRIQDVAKTTSGGTPSRRIPEYFDDQIAWLKSGELNDESVKAIGSPPAYLTRDALKKIADWKASRTKGYIKKNDPKYVIEVTRVSLTAQNEKLRLEVLTLLNGVSIRMASAILQFCFPNQYTVMDWRAWRSLKNLGKISGDIEDTYECYKKYNDVCQKIAEQFHVSLRTLDKALWQWKGGV